MHIMRRKKQIERGFDEAATYWRERTPTPTPPTPNSVRRPPTPPHPRTRKSRLASPKGWQRRRNHEQHAPKNKTPIKKKRIKKANKNSHSLPIARRPAAAPGAGAAPVVRGGPRVRVRVRGGVDARAGGGRVEVRAVRLCVGGGVRVGLPALHRRRPVVVRVRVGRRRRVVPPAAAACRTPRASTARRRASLRLRRMRWCFGLGFGGGARAAGGREGAPKGCGARTAGGAAVHTRAAPAGGAGGGAARAGRGGGGAGQGVAGVHVAVSGVVRVAVRCGRGVRVGVVGVVVGGACAVEVVARRGIVPAPVQLAQILTVSIKAEHRRQAEALRVRVQREGHARGQGLKLYGRACCERRIAAAALDGRVYIGRFGRGGMGGRVRGESLWRSPC
ncbi:hypothetical protein C8J57DRAFT_1630493 [Mycena rebaudengoi]|nr:hypothetical protein C8J57DRAFT_1630493 [Mycena rebaudengoi]